MNQNPLADELFAQLQGNPLQQISAQLGVDASQAQQAVGAALPLLLGALGRNAGQPQGAQSLFGALQRDHADTDLGGALAAALGGGGGAGAGILGHIFGQRQQRAELGLGQATGLGGQQAANLLQILAPIVMSFLAQRFAQGGAGAGGLADALGAERQRASQQGGLGGGLLGAVLDQDGDGQVDLGDLLKLGAGLLGPRR